MEFADMDGDDIARAVLIVAVIIPLLSLTVISLAKWIGRASRLLITETIKAAVTERFEHNVDRKLDGLYQKLNEVADENTRAHGAVAERLDSIEERLGILESRRRDDQPQEE